MALTEESITDPAEQLFSQTEGFSLSFKPKTPNFCPPAVSVWVGDCGPFYCTSHSAWREACRILWLSVDQIPASPVSGSWSSRKVKMRGPAEITRLHHQQELAEWKEQRQRCTKAR